jgi:hypothetical protein
MKHLRLSLLLVMLAVSLLALRRRSSIQAWALGIANTTRDQRGKHAPEFPAKTKSLEGMPLRLADLRGRVVLLHFFTFG